MAKNYWQEVQDSVAEGIVDGINMQFYKERPQNLNEALASHAARFPDKVAVVHEEKKLTYKELKNEVDKVAYNLSLKYGVKKGDRIAFLLMNGIPFVIGVYAALKIGAIAVPLNTKLKVHELEFMLENSAAKIVMANAEWWPNIEPIADKLPVEYYFITEEQTPEGTFPFLKLTEGQETEEIIVLIEENDSAFIMYTSGTTGKPKGALISHFNMIHTVINYEKCYKLTAEDSTIIAVPVFHITGLAAQLMTFIYLGGKVVLMSKFAPQLLLELLQKEKVTHLIASPTVYVMTLQHPEYVKYDVSNFRVAGFGGAPMPSETLKALKKWLPAIEVHNTYGLTETTSPVVIMPETHQMKQLSAVGVPTPVTEVKVVKPETNLEVQKGEVGELLFKGPMVIKQYWNNEEANRKSFHEGWFSTGDLAIMDEEGFITIMDRIKDMINRGGEKIYSVEVEDILYSNPKILEAAIVGIPDEKYGEAVKACVVCRSNEILSEGEIREWVQERLAKYKVPYYVEIMEMLPRNPNGKVMKNELRYIPETSKL